MSKILVSGSTAYDFVMDYRDEFQNHIKPESIHKISVVFLIDMLKKEYGWTGHNIAYNLALLNSSPILLSGVGYDYVFSEIVKQKVDLRYIYKSQDLLSSSFYVTSDIKGSQIGAFYPGAMDQAYLSKVDSVTETISYASVSPNNPRAMLEHATELFNKKIPFFFDPGQQIFIMQADQIRELYELGNFLILNDYEFDVFREKLSLSLEEIIASWKKVIVTKWENWSTIYDSSWSLDIKAVPVNSFVDPTGAGDAYRAGLLRGLELGYSWEKSAKMWSLMGSIAVTSYGAQNHFITPEEFIKSFETHFGETIEL